MKKEYDFSKGKRGRVLPPKPEPAGETRITVRIDRDVVSNADQCGAARIFGRKIAEIGRHAAPGDSGGVEAQRGLRAFRIRFRGAPTPLRGCVSSASARRSPVIWYRTDTE